MAGGNNRQRKSAFKSVLNIFKSNSSRHRSSSDAYYYDDGPNKATSWTKVWPSDEDRGRWGVADPVIDTKATTFIAQYKKRFSESELHYQEAQQ
ncbi:hypothetical protein HN51_054590 [Arachis hypogaea]|uniref:Uncharacterized protein n=1 Tax=Arachis hypogaea TaxID=3818 RepID=A0A6B9V780_ARAHY|nr:uncharacterized protein DS421_19g650440 [Arachis hypogaea]QHO34253.1 uncharacterized protein DS421_9g265350 [Arachis hypogaea]